MWKSGRRIDSATAPRLRFAGNSARGGTSHTGPRIGECDTDIRGKETASSPLKLQGLLGNIRNHREGVINPFAPGRCGSLPRAAGATRFLKGKWTL